MRHPSIRVAPNFDDLAKGEVTAEEKRSFASWKFDLLDALAVDRRLSPLHFRVAYCLLQFMNSRTGRIYPGQDLLAARLGVSVDTIQRAIKGLAKAGWLTVWRPTRHRTNEYRFCDRHVAAMEDYRISLDEDVHEKRRKQVGTEAAALRHRSIAEPATLRLPEPARALPEHLTRNNLKVIG